MTRQAASNTESRMGRPPLNVKPVLVRLPADVPDRIDAIAGKNRRAEFIREAVEKELELREADVNGQGEVNTLRSGKDR